MEIIVQRRAEHHAALLKHILGQHREHAACRGIGPRSFLRAPCGKDRRLRSGLTLLEHRTDVGAVTADDAGVRHRGVEKPLTVRQHMNGALAAAVGARTAAGTVGFIG